ncbi:MAG: SGNH/GDSL hydrolase family protein, partial [Cyanobacteria bacterium J06638_6]
MTLPFFSDLSFPLLLRFDAFGERFLLGSFGDDRLNGEAADEVLVGLWGDDQIFGAGGDNSLWGGLGNDFLDGGQGLNRLTGGPGEEIFALKRDGRVDTIVDFTAGVDRLHLLGGLSLSQLAIAQQDANTVIRYLGRPEPSLVLLDVDATTLTAADFRTQALVPSFDGLTVFGDSLSDPGNLFALTGFFPPPPYDQGRFSNGDLWVDYLADDIGLDSNLIQNFAFGGATTGRDNGLDALFESLTGVDPELPGLADQIDAYVAGLGDGPADPDDLYVLWAGANNLFNLPSNPADIP